MSNRHNVRDSRGKFTKEQKQTTSKKSQLNLESIKNLFKLTIKKLKI